MNPALGVRGLRLGLRNADLFETQLRALLEADPEGPLRILLPMVATVEEVAAARRAIDAAATASTRAGVAVATDVRLGIMVEIPSVAIVAEAFAPRAASVGEVRRIAAGVAGVKANAASPAA